MAEVLNAIRERERECVAFLDFFAKAQEAQELIKNCGLNLYVSRDRLSHRTKIIISRSVSIRNSAKRGHARVLNKNVVS